MPSGDWPHRIGPALFRSATTQAPLVGSRRCWAARICWTGPCNCLTSRTLSTCGPITAPATFRMRAGWGCYLRDVKGDVSARPNERLRLPSSGWYSTPSTRPSARGGGVQPLTRSSSRSPIASARQRGFGPGRGPYWLTWVDYKDTALPEFCPGKDCEKVRSKLPK